MRIDIDFGPDIADEGEVDNNQNSKEEVEVAPAYVDDSITIINISLQDVSEHAKKEVESSCSQFEKSDVDKREEEEVCESPPSPVEEEGLNSKRKASDFRQFHLQEQQLFVVEDKTNGCGVQNIHTLGEQHCYDEQEEMLLKKKIKVD